MEAKSFIATLDVWFLDRTRGQAYVAEKRNGIRKRPPGSDKHLAPALLHTPHCQGHSQQYPVRSKCVVRRPLNSLKTQPLRRSR